MNATWITCVERSFEAAFQIAAVGERLRSHAVSFSCRCDAPEIHNQGSTIAANSSFATGESAPLSDFASVFVCDMQTERYEIDRIFCEYIEMEVYDGHAAIPKHLDRFNWHARISSIKINPSVILKRLRECKRGLPAEPAAIDHSPTVDD
ncbi:UNVERIFIED_ORG: hypothetical protein GGD58_003304 [Rhizobium pisi]